MKENNRTIIKIILISIAIMCCLVVVMVTCCVLFFTADVADFAFKCGLNALSSDLYACEYSKSKNINYIAKSCNIDISINDYNRYIKHYPYFMNDSSYDNYISYINKVNYEKETSLLVKSSLINENNYYSKFYIKSLIINNEHKLAYDYAISRFLSINITDINYKVVNNYLLSDLINTSFYDTFWDDILQNNEKVYKLLLNYYNAQRNHYNDIVFDADCDIVYYINFCRSVIMVANDILVLDEKMDIIDNNESVKISNDISNINQQIRNCLEEQNE